VGVVAWVVIRKQSSCSHRIIPQSYFRSKKEKGKTYKVKGRGEGSKERKKNELEEKIKEIRSRRKQAKEKMIRSKRIEMDK
jgi:hypothetical protein